MKRHKPFLFTAPLPLCASSADAMTWCDDWALDEVELLAVENNYYRHTSTPSAATITGAMTLSADLAGMPGSGAEDVANQNLYAEARFALRR
jgi:hypothetical protein